MTAVHITRELVIPIADGTRLPAGLLATMGITVRKTWTSLEDLQAQGT